MFINLILFTRDVNPIVSEHIIKRCFEKVPHCITRHRISNQNYFIILIH